MDGTVLFKVPVVDLTVKALTDKTQATVVEAALVEALLRRTFLRHNPGPEVTMGLMVVMVVLMNHIIIHDLAHQARPEASVLEGLVED